MLIDRLIGFNDKIVWLWDKCAPTFLIFAIAQNVRFVCTIVLKYALYNTNNRELWAVMLLILFD